MVSYKVNGSANAGEFLTGNMDFFTFMTTLDITPTGVVAELDAVNPEGVFPFDAYGRTFATADEYNTARDSQARFDFVVQTVGLRAQPVLLGAPALESLPAPIAGLPDTNSTASGALIDVYSLKLAIEHTKAWDNVDVTLLDLFDGNFGFVYTVPSTQNNVTFTKADVL